MKTKRFYSLIVAMLLMIIGIQAQESNKLYIPDVRAGVGENAVLPVYVENTSKIITGIQFTIKVEEGIAVNINNTAITERLSNHKLTVASKGDSTYTVMIYSSDNTVLSGNDGIVANLPIYIADTVKVGAKKAIEISKVVLSDNTGNNVLTESSSGIINTIKYPQLTLKAAKQEVKEGEKILFTITNEDAPSVPLDISISSDMPARLNYPSTVTMEANKSSVTFEVEAVDNIEISDTLTASIKVSAAGHKDGECLLLIIDDDMPEIELELKPNIVSEGDGLTAILGKIIRKTNIENSVTIVLSDDSEGQLYYSNDRITMAAGVTEVEFTMGAIDNAVIDNERHYNVTASVYISSCNCSAKETSIGSMTKQITVTDDDGPTLKLASSMTSVKEGASITFNITHNVNTDKDVTVNLTSDNDDAFEYDHNIIIPAGQNSIQVQVIAKENEVIEGNRTVVFTIKSDGYATGTCWIQLTDQNIPDVSIKSFSIEPSKLEVGQKTTATVVLRNKGNSALPSLTRVNFYISNSKKELGHAYTADTLAVDSELTITHELEMPNTPGDYTLRAIVNENQAIKELTYSNNSSQSMSITLLPAFTATAQTDKSVYTAGETVIFSGKATGTKAANSDVEVYFIKDGYRQTISTTTDDQGDYSVEYTLPKTSSGHYVVGACYPNENLRTEMASFDVYGLLLSACSNNIEFYLDDTYQGSITLTNAVNLKQTGLKVTQGTTPDDCVFAFSIPETIEGNETVTFNFTITPSVVSTDRIWHKMPITITSSEGTSTDYNINYYINSRSALLSSNVSSINTTMTKGAKRDYPVTITNKGEGETGKITLDLPEWIKTSTPQEMASLAQADSATIVLQLEPMEEMQLNVPVEGEIVIKCENGSDLPISFSITPVSESEGKLIVDVVDEFTFETQEAPHVMNAKIEVKSPTTGELIAQGNSGEDGKFTITLPEGQYAVTVTAENHEEYNNQIIVDAGKDNNHEAFVGYDAVTYSWDVVETEIEDSYEIETIVKYDTRVPKPVILISLPKERPEDGSIIPIVVTNKGFINAEDVNVSLAISGDWNVEFLTEPYLAKLVANQSEVFYAKLSYNGSVSARKKAPSLNECLSLQAKLCAHYICGNKYDNTVTADDLRRWGQCLNYAASHGYSYGGSGGGGGYGPGGSVDGGYSSGWWQIVPIPTKACKPGDWNNNPDNLDTPSDPIDLSKFDPEKEEPEEQNCDSKEELKLVYKIIPVEGTKYLVKGVAADGISQVKLVLDPDSSTVPPQDCENFYDFEWRLSNKNLGKIEGDSYEEAIYTAPDIFPEKYDSKTYVEATLWYTQRTDEHTTYGRHTAPVKIEIIRPPVVFVHGLGDRDTCWYRLDKWLTEFHYYEDSINFRVDYSGTNTSAFDVNVPVIGRGILTARRQALNKGYIASKCDLVGHSMGGILSRLYAQRGGSDEINRLITVNTPHAGSEFGDAVVGHDVLLGTLARLWYRRTNIDAVRDLAVESSAIAQLNQDVALRNNIPVFALATQKNGIATLASELGIGAALDWGGGKLIAAGMLAGPGGFALGLSAGVACKYLSHVINDDLTQIGVGDLIVSTQSQIGGCSSYNVIGDGIVGDGPWHVNSPNDYKVIKAVSDLLREDNNSSVFSKNWFAPAHRTFDHSLWQLGLVSGMATDFIGKSDKFAKAADAVGLVACTDENLKAAEGVSKGLMINSAIQGTRNFVEGSVEGNARRMKANINSSSEDERCLKIGLNEVDGFSDPLVTIAYGDMNAALAEGYNVELSVPSYYSGDANIVVFMKNEDGNVYYEEYVYTFEGPKALPESLYIEDSFIEKGDSVNLRLYCIWNDGQKSKVIPSNIVFENEGIVNYEDGMIVGLKKGVTNAIINFSGLTCNTIIRVFDAQEENNYQDGGETSNSVCSTITLSFKQEMVMTRQAFRGTLTVNNGDAVNEMKDVKLNLEVKDEAGNVATSHEFQINADSISGFEGILDLTSGWTLEAKGTGIATILFIPTKYAAPTEPKQWSFGGTFSYTDPSTGLAVTKTLNPVTLTVKPSPNLAMDYFMQRDVLGDDALTEDIVEPMVPAEFSLLINNKGYGDATNVKMVTNQPEIIDNEKGLLINFEILSSQLNGGEKTLALGKSVATDFGTIPAGKTTYAQWWFTSSLLGHFTEYDVKATHLTSYGNPDLTLLDTVAVHELIHTLTIPKVETMRGFLVNDEKDSKDLPDMLYMTDGTVKAVGQASATLTDEGNNTYTLTAEPTSAGWNYGNLIDPTNGHKVLSSVTRNSDGTSISLNNFWQTDRTLRDNKDPLYEYRLHFADDMAATGETYTLTFVDKPMTILDVDSIVGASEEDGIVTEPIEKVTVYFNKDVATSTFTTEDLELTHAGSKLEVEKIGITKINERQFDLDIKELTTENGYYVLTVQTAGIKDTESFNGEYGRKQSWTQYRDGKIDIILNYEVEKGWNWISSNLEDKDKSDVNIFLDPIKDKVDRLVGFKSELINDPEYGFVGGLTSINPIEGYKLLVNDSAKFSYNGKAIEPSTNAIILNKGWNWIGYQPVLPLSVETALEGFSPSENDVLKGQDAFSTFTDNKWIGTLTEMYPGEGYMYYSGETTSLTYPKVYPTNETTARKRSKRYAPEVPWRYDVHQYADNMTLIGKLFSGDNLAGDDNIVAAFVETECRGIGKYVDGLVFMTIHGTLSTAETINFRVYSKKTGEELAVLEKLLFDGHGIGSVKQPMSLHLGGATNISSVSSGFSISPRPIRNKLYVNGDINNLKSIQILSANGQKVLSVNRYSTDGLDVGKLVPGIYIVVLTRYDGTTYHEKVMKINI